VRSDFSERLLQVAVLTVMSSDEMAFDSMECDVVMNPPYMVGSLIHIRWLFFRGLNCNDSKVTCVPVHHLSTRSSLPNIGFFGVSAKSG